MSTHIKCAPPIVSQDANFLTKQFYDNIFLTENAKDNVTANGSPSGTATTTIAIDSIKNLRIIAMCSDDFQPVLKIYSINNRPVRVIKTMIAETIPKYPILVASKSNFSYKGVF